MIVVMKRDATREEIEHMVAAHNGAGPEAARADPAWNELLSRRSGPSARA